MGGVLSGQEGASALAASIAAYDENAADYQVWSAGLTLTEQLNRFAASVPAAARVLDAGCGPGRDLAELAVRGLAPSGVDASAAFVSLARAAGHTVALGDLRCLPYLDGSFAGIWACASLVHLDVVDTALALAEFARVGAAGSALFVTVKAGQDSEAWADTRHGRRWFRYWSPATFAAAVGAAGWHVTAVDTRGSDDRTWVDIHAVWPVAAGADCRSRSRRARTI